MEQTASFLTRRKLIAGLAAVTAGAVALMAAPFRVAIATATRDLVRSQPILRRMLLSLANAGYEEWLDQVGSTFVVGGSSLKLVAVTPFGTTGTRPTNLGRNRAFMAKFDVQNGGTMAGDLIYNASHPLYGPFRIFLSASSDPAMRHRMTALYN